MALKSFDCSSKLKSLIRCIILASASGILCLVDGLIITNNFYLLKMNRLDQQLLSNQLMDWYKQISFIQK